MIEQQVINGRSAVVMYMDDKFEPVEKGSETLVKINFDNGEVLFLTHDVKREK